MNIETFIEETHDDGKPSFHLVVRKKKNVPTHGFPYLKERVIRTARFRCDTLAQANDIEDAIGEAFDVDIY